MLKIDEGDDEVKSTNLSRSRRAAARAAAAQAFCRANAGPLKSQRRPELSGPDSSALEGALTGQKLPAALFCQYPGTL